jgi:hypothetical protein
MMSLLHVTILWLKGLVHNGSQCGPYAVSNSCLPAAQQRSLELTTGIQHKLKLRAGAVTGCAPNCYLFDVLPSLILDNDIQTIEFNYEFSTRI